MLTNSVGQCQVIVSGTVTDSASGQPLQNASIVTSSGLQLESNRYGFFSFQIKPNTTVFIQSFKDAYKPALIKINCFKNGNG